MIVRRLVPLAAGFVLLGLTAACEQGGELPGDWGGRGGFPMGEWSMEMPAGIPASELPEAGSPDARLVAEYCSACHGIPSPRRHSAEVWETTARRMFRRMEHMGRMGRGMMRGRMGMMDVPVPTREEERRIVTYLREHALDRVDPGAIPEAGSETARLFARACSRCHDLPDPSQRAPDEWPAVVERMRGHMQEMEVEELSDDEARAVTEYLRRAAGGGPASGD